MQRVLTDTLLMAGILAAIYGMSVWAPSLMLWSLGWR